MRNIDYKRLNEQSTNGNKTEQTIKVCNRLNEVDFVYMKGII